jgi:uncharacterized protein Yka (UPF0111/DUF47 family)
MKKKEVLPFEDRVANGVEEIARHLSLAEYHNNNDIVEEFLGLARTIGALTEKTEKQRQSLKKQLKRIADAMEESNKIKKIKLKR